MRRTNIHLDEAQTASLDKLAAQQGVSRAELIRRLLDRALSNTEDDLASDLTAIRASFCALRDAETPPRGPGDREDHLDQMRRRTS